MSDRSDQEFRAWAASRTRQLRSGAFLMLGDWHDAEDVVQDVLERVYAAWPRITRSGDPTAYAHRAVVNRCIDHRRRSDRREVPADPVPEHSSADPGPPTGVEVRSDLIAALRDVPVRQRAVLVLRFWEDLSVEQTAEVLGIAPGTVKSQASRGVSALRTALERRGIDAAVLSGESP